MDGVVAPTQAQAGGKSTTTYFWIIVFFWDENMEKPFGIFPLSTFEKTDFPFKWITGALTMKSRSEELRVNGWTPFSVFAKVQEG